MSLKPLPTPSSPAASPPTTAFTIVGNELRTNASFDYEAKSSYTIRVRTTHQVGLFFDETFIISVTDVFELPPGSTPLTNLRSRIAANDAAIGTGYILYSQQNVKQHFTSLLTQNAAFPGCPVQLRPMAIRQQRHLGQLHSHSH